MNRAEINKNKLIILSRIKENKHILLGNLKNDKISKMYRQRAWNEILFKAQSLKLAKFNQNWTFARDNLFGLWKSRALAKCKRFNQNDGKKKKLDEVDKAILDILKPDELDEVNSTDIKMENNDADLESLPLSISSRTNEPNDVDDYIQIDNKNRKSAIPVTSENIHDSEKQLRIELLELEIYHRKLNCLKLERELNLEPSKFTEYILNSLSE